VGLAVLDSSVVIASIDDQDALHRRSVEAIRSIRKQHALAVPAVAYAEVLVGAYGHGEHAVATVETFVLAAPVRELSPAMARRAASLRAEHGLPLPDALIVGAALELNADVILTADRRWKKVDPRVHVI
jgi:predicted nucleic acid-binding protein